MRISGLLGAVIALSVLTPIAPARADISSGDLMVTDLFRWQGQDGAPTWREILAKFDCTEELTFYLWNVPSPPPPIVIPPTPVIDPLVAANDPIGLPDSVDGGAPIVVDPIGTPGGGVPSAATAVPEPSTWAMLLLGFAGLGYAGFRRSKGPRDLFIANETGALVRQAASPARPTIRTGGATSPNRASKSARRGRGRTNGAALR
jgi:PEP-CTERM motif